MSGGELNKIRERREHWEAEDAAKSSDRFPVDETQTTSLSGIPIKPIYDPEDAPPSDYLDEVGYPGQYPFTRGIYPLMHRARPWTRRQVVGVGDAEASNKRHQFVVNHGQTGISTDFDLPTLVGLDSDDPDAAGEVGRVGVAIDSSLDMLEMVHGLDLVTTGPAINVTHPAVSLYAMYLDCAKRLGIDMTAVGGTIQNEPLQDFITMKCYVYPAEPCVKLAGDLIEFSAKHTPKFHPISVRAYHLRDSGATADQEIGFSFALATAYIDEVVKRGVPVDDFAPRFSSIFYVHGDFLEEIAKFRAARRLWARLMKERYGAKDDRSCHLRIHVQTGGSTLTAQEPELNLVRSGFQALAAVLGGVQSMALSTYDEAYSTPSEKAQRLALRTQQLILHETGVTRSADPLGGSYLIESLTDELEERAQQWIQRVEDEGGPIVCAQSGYIETLLADQAYQYQRSISDGDRVIVGVNSQGSDEDEQVQMDLYWPDDQVEEIQKARLKEHRRTRDSSAVRSALHEVTSAARQGRNVIGPLVDAVGVGATEGETTLALVEVYGRYEEALVY